MLIGPKRWLAGLSWQST